MLEQELTDKIRTGGGICFWKSGISDRSLLEAGLTQLDLKKFAPEERTATSALQGALQSVFKKGKESSRILVRPLEDKDGFAVLRETRGDKHAGNKAATICTATLPTETSPTIVMYGDYQEDQYDEVVAEYRFLSGTISASAVSKCLDRVIEYLDGVDLTAALRDSGEGSNPTPVPPSAGGCKSLWWIPKSSIDSFKQVAGVVESCGLKKNPDDRATCNRVNALTCIADEAMVRAVGDGLTTELTNEVAQIEYDVANEEMTTKKMANRREKAVKMRAKLERYERAFDVYVAKLHEDLDRVDTATAAAIILESAASVREGSEQLELVTA